MRPPASTSWSAWRPAGSSSPARSPWSSGAGFVPVRKPGKLPGDVYTQTFSLEYGDETLAVHTDAIMPGSRVLVIDDVLATGGTVGATAALIRRLGAELVHVSVLLELSFLGGREHLATLGITETSAVLTV